VLPADDPGYGFAGDGIPELSLGVLAGRRGQGIGSRLLSALLEPAGRAGYPAVSLSVERDNPALRLHRRLGFVEVGSCQGSLTLLKRLRPLDGP
jgi:GNAT superfamily N-acetyltransferase